MRKRILVVCNSFQTGGIQTAMVNLANNLCERYDVDVLVYRSDGATRSRLKKNVEVVEAKSLFHILSLSVNEALASRRLTTAAFRLTAAVWAKLFNNKAPIQLAIHREPRRKGYDVAIAYHHEGWKNGFAAGFSRLIAQRVDAKKKLVWLHYDCNLTDVDTLFNAQFYAKLDNIVCVSKALSERFAEKLPALREKIDYCYNFYDFADIARKCEEKQATPYPNDAFVCFSACRLSSVKALPRAVNALAPVFKENKRLYWFIAGDGDEKDAILDAIKTNGLEEQIVLLGNQSNPYPYMRNADVVMNVSYHEAAPMVYTEALATGVPVFATKTSSTEEFLIDGENAVICENNEESMREKFRRFVERPETAARMKERLANYAPSNETTLKKFQELTGLNEE